MPHAEITDHVFPHAYKFESGMIHPGDAPGIGVDINEELAAKYPFAASLSSDQSQAGWNHAQLVAELCSLLIPALYAQP